MLKMPTKSVAFWKEMAAIEAGENDILVRQVALLESLLVMHTDVDYAKRAVEHALEVACLWKEHVDESKKA